MGGGWWVVGGGGGERGSEGVGERGRERERQRERQREKEKEREKERKKGKGGQRMVSHMHKRIIQTNKIIYFKKKTHRYHRRTFSKKF